MANGVEFVPDQAKTEAVEAHVIWMTTGLSCDGDSVAMTSAVEPEPRGHRHPGDPGDAEGDRPQPGARLRGRRRVHAGLVRRRGGQARPVRPGRRGLDPERGAQRRGPLGGDGDDPDTGQPITTNEWVDRLAPKAAAVVALGTCATYGGIPAMKNNPTGAMGLADYLGWDWKSSAGLPVVNIPGCPAQPDNTTESLLYLALHLAGRAPVPDLDEAHRPTWLFGRTVREGCNRAGFAEQGEFATEYGSDHRCLVKLGCKGPVVKCNVPVRGWQSGVGGCPNVGGICMACTMPGFPDKYMPFMDEDRWGGGGGEHHEVHLRADRALGPPPQHPQQVRQRARVAQARRDPDQRLQVPIRRLRAPGSRRPTSKEERDRWQPPRLRHIEEGRASRRCRGTRSRGSSAASASTRRSTSTPRRCEKCYSTSMIFRGFDIFMKGIDPRDTHFITSRICGICGDNHCTTSCLNQNMAYGVKPPALGDLGYNLAETADYMFDHAIFNDCMANVDFCEQMVRETNPSLLQKAEETPAPHADVHGYKTIADIMRSLNPFTGDFYLETLQVARYTREMYCLFGGRHTHPSTIMPGGCQRRHHAPDLHGLLRAADALHRLRQAGGADARRPLRLLPPGVAGVRHGRLPRHRPRLLGLLRRPRLRRLRLPEHGRVGAEALHHPGRRARRAS